MTGRIKRKTRPEKGWRPSRESSLPEGIRAADIDRMAQQIQEILADSHTLDDSERTLLKQAQLLSRRVIAHEKGDILALNQLNSELARHQDVLHRHGFKARRDIVPLNLWITRRLVFQKQGLVELLEQVESKINARAKQ